MDIEEENQQKQILDKQAIEIARSKFPYLFQVYDERQSLKFKSEKWLRS